MYYVKAWKRYDNPKNNYEPVCYKTFGSRDDALNYLFGNGFVRDVVCMTHLKYEPDIFWNSKTHTQAVIFQDFD